MLTLLQVGTMAVEALVAGITSDAYSEARGRLVNFLKGKLSNPEAVDHVASNKDSLKESIIEQAAQDPEFKQELERLITVVNEAIKNTPADSGNTIVRQDNVSVSDGVNIGGSVSQTGDIVGGDKS
jgi:hypothetical protein